MSKNLPKPFYRTPKSSGAAAGSDSSERGASVDAMSEESRFSGAAPSEFGSAKRAQVGSTKLVIAILAHPDDETFGMGGTLAKHVHDGHEVHVINVTRGEAGRNHAKDALSKSDSSGALTVGQPSEQGVAKATASEEDGSTDSASSGSEAKRHYGHGFHEPEIEKTRELEAKKAAEILNIHNHHFLDFIDGTLSNGMYHDIADAIWAQVESIIDDREIELDVLTFERMGISGHLDHIAVSMITTYVYRRKISRQDNLINPRLLYLVTCNKSRPGPNDNYFVYGPGGVDPCAVDITVDASGVLDQKIAAIKAHASQNPEFILSRGEELLSREYFQIYDGN